MKSVIVKIFRSRIKEDLWRRFYSGIAWNFIAAVLFRGFGLINVIILARLLGVSGYGAFGIVQNTVSTLAFISSVTMGVTATKYLSQYRNTNKERAGEMISLCWIVASTFGAALTLVVFLSSSWLAEILFSKVELGIYLKIAAIVILIECLTGVQRGILVGLEQFRYLTYVSAIFGISSVPLTYILTINLGIFGAIYSVIISGCLLLISLLFFTRKQLIILGIKIKYKGIAKDKSVLLNFSTPHLLGSLLNMPVYWICNTMLVRQPDGIEQVGVFNAVNRWREAILFIPNSLSNVAATIHAERVGVRDYISIKKLLKSSLVIVFIVATILSLILYLFSDFILSLYGEEFLEKGRVIFAVILIVAVVQGLAIPLSNLITAMGKLWLALLCSIVVSGGLLSMSYSFVDNGAVGLSYAYLAASIISVVLLSFVVVFILSIIKK